MTGLVLPLMVSLSVEYLIIVSGNYYLMDKISRRLFNRLSRLKRRQTPLTTEERANLINSVGLYKLLSNHSPAVSRVVTELLERK